MFGRKKRVVVLGCGPAGLFAAHALTQNGWDVTIYSKKRKSEMFGAQYLHEPIPGLTDPRYLPVMIDYQLRGEAENYRRKIYGTRPIKVSVETLTKMHPAWNIRDAYNVAWILYADSIQAADVKPESIYEIRNSGQFNLVVSTIPLDSLCLAEHRFHSEKIWAIGDAPERGTFCPIEVEPATVVCDGTLDVGWYRAANVYGYKTAEWPGRSKPPLPGVAEVVKPLYHDCSCHGPLKGKANFIPLGRYGQWAKGVLSHHAYTQAAQL